MQAIVSVANRAGIIELARELQTLHVTIYSTGGTAKHLQDAEIAVEPINNLTNFPEILDGRVKTLHPAVFGGILARRDESNHLRQLQEHGLAPIDLVVTNLYPFIETIAKPETTFDEALEQIDIGGVSLIRAAAKNFRDVIVLVRPQDYLSVMKEWAEQGQVSLETRQHLAVTAFDYIASYDSAIATYLRQQTPGCERFPEKLTVSLERIQSLRYGENPHQEAAFYSLNHGKHTVELPSVAHAEVLHGKELSYNNLLDLDAALGTANSFAPPTVAIIKHTNPCGLACDDNLVNAYKKAHAGDTISAFGGIIGLNRTVDEATAEEINQLFYEAVIAPDYSRGALEILKRKKNIRLLATHTVPNSEKIGAAQANQIDVRTVSGGLLLQTTDIIGEQELSSYEVVTERGPNLDEVTDLLFAWKAVRHVKSNAIVLARKLSLLGVGAGQMNRVTSVQLAVEKAGDRARGSVLASDAFFPFATV